MDCEWVLVKRGDVLGSAVHVFTVPTLSSVSWLAHYKSHEKNSIYLF